MNNRKSTFRAKITTPSGKVFCSKGETSHIAIANATYSIFEALTMAGDSVARTALGDAIDSKILDLSAQGFDSSDATHDALVELGYQVEVKRMLPDGVRSWWCSTNDDGGVTVHVTASFGGLPVSAHTRIEKAHIPVFFSRAKVRAVRSPILGVIARLDVKVFEEAFDVCSNPQGAEPSTESLRWIVKYYMP